VGVVFRGHHERPRRERAGEGGRTDRRRGEHRRKNNLKTNLEIGVAFPSVSTIDQAGSGAELSVESEKRMAEWSEAGQGGVRRSGRRQSVPFQQGTKRTAQRCWKRHSLPTRRDNVGGSLLDGLGGVFAGLVMITPKSASMASVIRKRVSRVGLRRSRSIRLMMEWDNPERCATTFMESPRCSRIWRSALPRWRLQPHGNCCSTRLTNSGEPLDKWCDKSHNRRRLPEEAWFAQFKYGWVAGRDS